MTTLFRIKAELSHAVRTEDAPRVARLADQLTCRGIRLADGTIVRWSYAEFIELAKQAGVDLEALEELLQLA